MRMHLWLAVVVATASAAVAACWNTILGVSFMDLSGYVIQLVAVVHQVRRNEKIEISST